MNKVCERICDPIEVLNKIPKGYRELQGLCGGPPSQEGVSPMEMKIHACVTFSTEEIIKPIDSTNPHKGIGPDGFCGLIFSQDK